MKVLGYLRVSTEGQAGEDRCGLDVQKEAIIKYCAKNDYELIGFVEDKISGAKLDRPSLNKIIYEDDPSDYDAVCVFKIDRISRQVEGYYYIKMLLKKKNVEILSTQEQFSEMGMFAPLLESFVVFVAQMERQNIIMRTHRAKVLNRKEGKHSSGQVPYGYRKGVNKVLEIDEKEKAMVISIFNLRNSGYSYNHIAQKINKFYTSRKGKDIDSKTIYRIVQNEEFYRGMVKDADGKWVQGKHPSILD